MSETPPDVVAFYSTTDEASRLEQGSAQLEFERTKELITRFLPSPPARIVDIGGGSGPYAFWLASLGYEVHLVDATPRLLDLARRREGGNGRLASIGHGDARRLTFSDAAFDAALLLGPLYHLTSRSDRLAALAEAARILRPRGVLMAAGISRYAGTLDGLAFHPPPTSDVLEMRHRALTDGQYRNDTGNQRYFITAYFHRPQDLAAELAESGFGEVRVLGIEGPGWLVTDFAARWADEAARAHLLTVARLLEEEASIMGVSAHLVAVGRRL